MSNKNRRAIVGWLLSASCCIPAGMLSCNTDRSPCMEPVVAQPQLAFYQALPEAGSFADTLLPNANIVSLDIDSARYWAMGVDEQSKYYIILSPLHDTTRWSVQPDSAISATDTLTFVYQRRLQFLSNACGYTYFYTLSQVSATQHNIDSVSINNGDITTNAGAENVKIFF